jgi:hypothetical protein
MGPNGYNASYNKIMIPRIIAALEPTVANLTAQGLFDKLYAYGFDEFCGHPDPATWPESGGCKVASTA